MADAPHSQSRHRERAIPVPWCPQRLAPNFCQRTIEYLVGHLAIIGTKSNLIRPQAMHRQTAVLAAIWPAPRQRRLARTDTPIGSVPVRRESLFFLAFSLMIALVLNGLSA